MILLLSKNDMAWYSKRKLNYEWTQLLVIQDTLKKPLSNKEFKSLHELVKFERLILRQCLIVEISSLIRTEESPALEDISIGSFQLNEKLLEFSKEFFSSKGLLVGEYELRGLSRKHEVGKDFDYRVENHPSIPRLSLKINWSEVSRIEGFYEELSNFLQQVDFFTQALAG